MLRAGLAMAATRQKTAVVLGSLVDRLADFVALGDPRARRFRRRVAAGEPPPRAGSGRHELDALARRGRLGVLASSPRSSSSGGAGARAASVRKIILELLVALRRLRPALLRSRSRASRSRPRSSSSLLLVHRELGIADRACRGDLAIWLFIWPLAKLVAMIPISLGGLGVREAAFARAREAVRHRANRSRSSTSLAWQAVLIVGRTDRRAGLDARSPGGPSAGSVARRSASAT